MPAREITLYLLVGPTACGKTEAGIVLARSLGAEIISMDSMAVYRGMDTGTAKPDAAQREQVPHHLIDMVEPWQSYTVARYVKDAEVAAADIIRRDKQILFVGGTGLYLKRFVEGIFAGPKADKRFREEARERAIMEGLYALHEELRKIDPDSAERIHPNDVKRVIRALEVHHLTGRTLSELQREGRRKHDEERRSRLGVGEIKYSMCALVRERRDLNHRIDERVRRMFDSGLVEEVKTLCELCGAHLPPDGRDKFALGFEASQALGYKEVLDFLNGRIPLEEAVEQTRLHTRQFATKQMTWFRNFPDMRYIELSADEESDIAADRALRTLTA
jgi:tRNA dimethylallyltransferase